MVRNGVKFESINDSEEETTDGVTGLAAPKAPSKGNSQVGDPGVEKNKSVVHGY